MNRKFDVILFDFDGTLVDSSEGIYNGLRYAFRAYQKPIPNEDILKKFIGPPLLDSFKELFHMDEQEADIMIAKYREYYNETGYQEVKVYDGIADLLKALQNNGVKMATASTKPKFFVERILKMLQLDSYFAYFGGTEFGKNPGTKPQIIEKGMQALGGTPQNTLMVGDRKFDILGAKEVGVPVAAVLYGFGNQKEFETYGADYIVDSVDALQNLLLKEESNGISARG